MIQCSKPFDKAENTPLSLSSSSKDQRHETDKKLQFDGKHIFRYDTFGDEDFWSGLLHLDKAILGTNLGGYGSGVSPKTALAVARRASTEQHRSAAFSQGKRPFLPR